MPNSKSPKSTYGKGTPRKKKQADQNASTSKPIVEKPESEVEDDDTSFSESQLAELIAESVTKEVTRLATEWNKKFSALEKSNKEIRKEADSLKKNILTLENELSALAKNKIATVEPGSLPGPLHTVNNLPISVAPPDRSALQVNIISDLLNRVSELEDEREARTIILEKSLEAQDKKDRECNAIVRGIYEGPSETHAHLWHKISGLMCKGLNNPEAIPVTVERLGRRSAGRPRPIKIKFQNKATRDKVTSASPRLALSPNYYWVSIDKDEPRKITNFYRPPRTTRTHQHFTQNGPPQVPMMVGVQPSSAPRKSTSERLMKLAGYDRAAIWTRPKPPQGKEVGTGDAPDPNTSAIYNVQAEGNTGAEIEDTSSVGNTDPFLSPE